MTVFNAIAKIKLTFHLSSSTALDTRNILKEVDLQNDLCWKRSSAVCSPAPIPLKTQPTWMRLHGTFQVKLWMLPVQIPWALQISVITIFDHPHGVN